MKFVSLFTGIGGIDLGLERAGWECVAQVEYDPWCTRILEKHWPDIPRWSDIHDVDPAVLPAMDAVVGGFPCQPVSLAGARLAQDDPRWLWPEFFRIVRAVRPRIVIVENVPGLASAGMGDVLGDLAHIGYDAEWQGIPAAAVGAPHLRWRLFIVAGGTPIRREDTGGSYAYESEHAGRAPSQADIAPGDGEGSGERDVADTASTGLEGTESVGVQGTQPGLAIGGDLADPDEIGRYGRAGQPGQGRRRQCTDSGGWPVEPDVGRVANGIPRRVDRLRGLGNAVVPQVAEWLGHRINGAL